MNSFGSQSTLKVGNKSYEIFRLNALEAKGLSLRRLPYSLRVLLENLLRQEDGKSVTADDIEFLAKWQASAEPAREIAFMPARVLMQDFTGVPAIVDLAAMRDAMKQLGGDPEKINPLQPAELVIDHSVQVDEYGTANAYSLNAALEFQRNRERYAFLKWGQTAFRNFSTVPPGNYKVYAWDDNTNVEYANPEWMQRNGKSVAVTVDPGQTAQVKLVRQNAPVE